jgi:hypothetical protein
VLQNLTEINSKKSKKNVICAERGAAYALPSQRLSSGDHRAFERRQLACLSQIKRKPNRKAVEMPCRECHAFHEFLPDTRNLL